MGKAHITEESRRTKQAFFLQEVENVRNGISNDWRVLAIPATLLLLKRKKKKKVVTLINNAFSFRHRRGILAILHCRRIMQIHLLLLQGLDWPTIIISFAKWQCVEGISRELRN
ncbi:hypothetical protein CEXT_492461 [Caerostris extrusa]|uniref:Uncharacterized protein n=1 Tax=Caerostris extrusa TaxID=172846 RepID=A0AAV4P0P0_CAEEX|nr:hypothetical protein CEXT_492461 [Caerostris extrusa]